MQADIDTSGNGKCAKIATKANKKKSFAENGASAKLNEPPVATDFMTTREAAAFTKFSRQFLEGARYRGDGSGPAYIKVGRSVRYRRSVLDAWMSAHNHSPDKPSQFK
jgi:hypothetical protein